MVISLGEFLGTGIIYKQIGVQMKYWTLIIEVKYKISLLECIWRAYYKNFPLENVVVINESRWEAFHRILI